MSTGGRSPRCVCGRDVPSATRRQCSVRAAARAAGPLDGALFPGGVMQDGLRVVRKPDDAGAFEPLGMTLCVGVTSWRTLTTARPPGVSTIPACSPCKIERNRCSIGMISRSHRLPGTANWVPRPKASAVRAPTWPDRHMHDCEKERPVLLERGGALDGRRPYGLSRGIRLTRRSLDALQPMGPVGAEGRLAPGIPGACCGRADAGQHPCQGPPLCRWRQRGALTQAIGRSRGGRTTKLHARVDGQGRPVALAITPGQRPDAPVAIDLLSQAPPSRILAADTAYDAIGGDGMPARYGQID